MGKIDIWVHYKLGGDYFEGTQLRSYFGKKFCTKVFVIRNQGIPFTRASMVKQIRICDSDSPSHMDMMVK